MTYWCNLSELIVWTDSSQPGLEEGPEQLLARIKRLIDFDGTITEPGQTAVARQTICRRPLIEFLGEEPYVVQTWNPTQAIDFFVKHRPDLPRPLMIIVAPVDLSPDGPESGKDFSGLGLRGALIVDDLGAAAIKAPGCQIVPP